MKGYPSRLWPWTSFRGKPRGNLNEIALERLGLNDAARIEAAGSAAQEVARIFDNLAALAPRARAALCNQPCHAAWDAVRDAETLLRGLKPRATFGNSASYIDMLRGIEKVVARHARA